MFNIKSLAYFERKKFLVKLIEWVKKYIPARGFICMDFRNFFEALI